MACGVLSSFSLFSTKAEVALYGPPGERIVSSVILLESPGLSTIGRRPTVAQGSLLRFPPVPLIPSLLACIQEEGLTAILVALQRTSAMWFPSLIQLLSGKAWQLPWRRDAGPLNRSAWRG